MRKGDRKETPTKLHLAHGTFIDIMTVNTFVVYFAKKRITSPAHRTFINTMIIYTFVVYFVGRAILLKEEA
jgi:hypothetical protein